MFKKEKKKRLFAPAKGQETIFLNLEFAAAPEDSHILRMSLREVLFLYNGHALFCDRILTPQWATSLSIEFILLAVSVAVILLLLPRCAS